MAEWKQKAADIIDYSPAGDSRAAVTLKTKRSFTHIFELAEILHEDILTLQNEISEMKNAVSEVQAENFEIKNVILTVQEKIAELESKINAEE